jgi:hypothetical protein
MQDTALSSPLTHPPSAITPRRRLLQRALVLAGGGLGLGLLTRGEPTLAAAVPRPASPGGQPSTLTLRGRTWHQYGPNHRPGEAPRVGDRRSTFGELLGAKSDTAIGEFHAAAMGTGSPFLSGPFAAGSIEFHTFNLPDGNILGMGSTAGGNSTFAIIGGTGRYLGVSGSYVARQHPFDLGGDGTAEFTFTFSTGGTSHGV